MTQGLIETIKEKISDELLKRGIDVTIDVTEEDGKVWIKSSPFQTMPVLFKKLYIETYSSIVTEQAKNSKGEEFTRRRLPLSMDVKTEYFDNGFNGLTLFCMELFWIDGSNIVRVR